VVEPAASFVAEVANHARTIYLGPETPANASSFTECYLGKADAAKFARCRLVWQFHTMRRLIPAQSKPRLLTVHHQQTISTVHTLPVIFIRSAANETDLIVLTIATESLPRKPMRARSPDESLQECHGLSFASHGPELGGVICSEKGEWVDLTTIGAPFQITRVHCGCGLRRGR
jgi:hypothetical protein